MQKYVITGGPGVGKTMLVNALRERGWATVHEAAREIIEDELARGGTLLPWLRPLDFQVEVLRRQFERERQCKGKGIAFLDRGVPDGLAYCRVSGIEPPQTLLATIAKSRYAAAFLLSPLTGYQVEHVRREKVEAAARIHREIEKVYLAMEVVLVPVPAMPVAQRVELIETFVHAQAEHAGYLTASTSSGGSS